MQKDKDIKGIQIEKKELKLYLIADYMIVYVENPRFCQQQQNLVSNCGKIVGCKFNTSHLLSYIPATIGI